MKKTMLTIAMFLAFVGIAQAQSNNTKVVKEGKTFTATKEVKRDIKDSTYTKTDYTYVDTDGVAYTIYLHTISRGENQGKTFCYIKRYAKKSGKAYWKKIDVKPEELKE